MWKIEERFRVKLGGNVYINVPNLVVCGDDTLFTLKRDDDNGELGIYFEIYDSAGCHVASVKRNQIYRTEGAKELYRLEGSADECRLIDSTRDQPMCQIRKGRTAPIELEVSVRLYTPKGLLFDASPMATNLPGGNLSECVFQDLSVGICISDNVIGIGGLNPAKLVR